LKAWLDSKDSVLSFRNNYALTINKNTNISVGFRQGQIIQVSGGANALRQAVGSAQNGDTLVVAAETYAGDIDIGGKQIKLFGVKPDDPGVVEKTIIDCNESKRGFIFDSGETENTVIDGFTIINAGGDVNDTLSGAAIYIGSNSSPTIVNVDIQNSTVYNANGAAIYIGHKCGPSLFNVNITNCQVNNGNGGAIYVGTEAYPKFTNCSIKNSSAFGGSGGAVYCSIRSTSSFIDCTFSDNSAGISAGAVYSHAGCDSLFQGCKFNNNTVLVGGGQQSQRGGGGGLYCSINNILEVNECDFANNTAGSGGAVFMSSNCSAAVKDTTFSTNFADKDGGAIYITDSNTIEITDINATENTALRGGGIFALNSPKVMITNCELNANRAYSLVTPSDPNLVGSDGNFIAQGGGIFAFASIEKIADCRITGNTANTSGGGIYIAGPQEDANYPQIFNCLIAKNQAGSDGGGVSVNWFANTHIQNCTIAENTVTNINGNGGGLFCSYGAYTDVKDTILWANIGTDGSQFAIGSGDVSYPLPSTINISYSDIDLRYTSGIDSTGYGSGGSGSTSAPRLVDEQTIYNEINASGSAKVSVTLIEPAEAETTNWASSASVSALQSKITTLQNQALSSVNPSEFTLRHRLTSVAAFSGNATVSGLSKLLVNPAVAHIEPVRTVSPMLAQAIPLANALTTRTTYNGLGSAIAIIDSGIDYRHPRLGGGTFPNSKVIGGYDTGDGDNNPIPTNDAHGTACAGIAAGLLGTVGDYIGGVAYNAKLYALKISQGSEDLLLTDAALAAWDWCITHRNDNPENPIRVMSNSWGIENYPINNPAEADALSPAFTTAAQTAVNTGITILAASGNDGFAGDGISWPAAMSNIISVGAVYDTTDTVTEYSNTANILDILAPADPVYTTDIIGSDGYSDGDYYPYFNGTSSACPFAAGCVAALQSASVANNGAILPPETIRSILKQTGKPVTDTKVAITKPRVNLGAAIAMLGTPVPVYTAPGCTITGIEKDVDDIWTVAGSSNISQDPCFVPGLSYYLSHTDTMQDYNSPCFNIGSTLAANLGLDTYTTRVDNFKDTDVVDLGYHYSEGIATRYELRVEISGSAWGTIKAPWSAGIEPYNVYAGQIITLEADPNADYKVADWFIDDVSQQTDSNNFVTMMDRNKKVSVSFEPVTAGTHQPLKINVPLDYPDLGSAINAAKDGDIIVLARGIYYGHETNFSPSTIWIDGKNITITSTSPEDPNTIAQTIIYGNGFTIFDVNRSMTIEGITIQDAHYYAGDIDCSEYWAHSENGDGYNGFSLLGGAMRLYNASPTIRNCQFINCSATGSDGCDGEGDSGDGGWAGRAYGGAIGIDSTSNPLIKNCNFIDNYVLGGNGGDGVDGDPGGHGGNWGDHTSNRWDFGPYQPYWYYSGKGGAIYCASGSKPVFDNCLFQGNVAYSGVCGTSDTSPDHSGWPQVNYALPAFGGAVYIARGSEAKFANCTFVDNEADTRGQIGDSNTPEGATIYSPVVSYGGGICIENTGLLDVADSTPIIENCTFLNNRACSGGGLYQKGTNAHLINNTFENCISMLGGGMSMVNNNSIIVDCYFNNNWAIEPAGLGGAIYSSSDTMFYDCQITGNNAAVAGGGAYFTNDFEPYMHNCLITNNNANRDGAGVAAAWGIELTLSNCTLANNTILGTGFASGYGGGLSCAYEAYTKVVNSILWNNNAEYGSEIAIGNMFDAADKYDAQIDITYSDVKDGQAGVFVDTENGCVLNWGEGNLNGTSLESPLFVIGPWGNFYLSQTATPDVNQTVDSPCVDIGLGSATDNNMHKHTTRTDHVVDIADSNVDMGYHYTLVADLLGDFNFDGIVTFEDFGLFILFWLDDGCTFPYYCAGRDLNKDGRVDFEDFALFAENYGKTETVPPRPDPMTWALSPRSAGVNSITMTATAARDNSSTVIEYYFECVSGGGHNRGWSTNTTYTDTGLTHGQEYIYRVKARDAKHNETKWSSEGYAVPGEDRTPPVPDPMAWAMVPYATSSNSIRMIATTAEDDFDVEYYFEETSGNLGGTTSDWQDSPIYEDIGLLPSTTYSYRVKARDKSPAQNQTGYSDIASVITPEEGTEPNIPAEDKLGPTPNPSQWAVVPTVYYDGTFYYHIMTAVEATDDSSPPVSYRFECTHFGGTTSNWQSESTYRAGPYLVENYSVYRVWTKDSAVPENNVSLPSPQYDTKGKWWAP
jgi:predicted outer membrane repeat protein